MPYPDPFASPSQESAHPENEPRPNNAEKHGVEVTPKLYNDKRPGDPQRVCQVIKRKTKGGQSFLRVNIFDENTGKFKYCIHCWECNDNYKAALTKNDKVDNGNIPDYEGKRKDITKNQQ